MTRAARILLVNYEYPPIGGGAGNATAALAAALAGMGCEVTVLTSRFGPQPPCELVNGFTIRRVPVVRRRADRCTPAEMLTFIVSAAIAALRLTKRARPDLTIAFFGIPGGPVAWLLRTCFGVSYIVSLRGGDVPGFNWAPGTERYHRVSAPLVRFIWRRALAVVANADGLKRLAESALPGLTVPVVPNGVDTDEHAPSTQRRRQARPGAVRLLLVGRLVHQKGCDVLLRAVSQLKHLQFTLEIVGDGPDREALQAQSVGTGLVDRVTFTGWVARDRIGDHYRAADVFVFPSRIEGMPNAVLEAMAHGLTVVATDVPGNRELVEHDRTGLLAETENDRQLAAALERVITDPTLRERLGAAARRHVIAQHSWQSSAAQYLALGGLMPAPEAESAILAGQAT